MNRKTICRVPLIFGLAILFIVPAFWSVGADAAEERPPLIDREIFFGDPQIAHAQISPSGSHIAFVKPYKKVLNIWVKETNDPFSAARPLTCSSSRPVSGYMWSRDGKYILFSQDEGGDENFHLWAIDPYSKTIPTPRDLTPYEGTRATLLRLPLHTPNTIYVGLNDRDSRYHDVYSIDLSTGQRSLIRLNEEGFSDWVFDREGSLRLGVRYTDDGGTEIISLDQDGDTVVWSCSRGESVQPFCFHKDGKHLYMATNKGSGVDLTRLILFNPETWEEEVVESDPECEVDFEEPVFSSVTGELVATSYIGDRERRYFLDNDWANDFQILKSLLPNGEISLVSSTDDDELWIVCLRSDIDPESAYLYDRSTKTVTFLYKSRPSLPSEHLSPMVPFVYKTRDGLTIHAYLTLPKGEEPRALPLVVIPHGGPWSRDTWGYDRYSQLLSNRGYAVLHMNFRGSVGYGKNFLNAGNKEWGDAMQNDITDGVFYLINQGIADPRRVAIFGASYGGYATLAGLAFTPNIYAAGISYVGPSSLITLLRTIPPYWSVARTDLNERLGDLDNPEDVVRLERQSPLFSAHQITAPLLVVQGANDPRVKKTESDQIVVALRNLDRRVEYIVAPDEGHGFAGVENRMALAVAIERFFAQHLGGRCQEDVPKAISNRLKAITVDVERVGVDESTTEQ